MLVDVGVIGVGIFLMVIVSPWVSKPSRDPRFGDPSPDGAPFNRLLGGVLGLACIVYGIVALIS